MKAQIASRTMVVLALSFPSAAAILYAQVQAASPDSKEPPRPTRGFQRPVTSPDVAPDRRVTFRLRAPDATAVTLSGEFLSGSKPLVKDSDNI